MKIFIRKVRILFAISKTKGPLFSESDLAIHSPFYTVDFIENIHTTLKNNRCSITPECHLKGNENRSHNDKTLFFRFTLCNRLARLLSNH